MSTPPTLQVNGSLIQENKATAQSFGEPNATASGLIDSSTGGVADRPRATRNDTNYSKFSTMSVPPEGSILTGKQEHCRWTF